MRRISFSVIFMAFVFNLAAQKKDTLVCPDRSVNVWASLESYSPLPRYLLKREDLLNGFTLALTDRSYKIVGFRVFFEFDSCPMGDRWIKGNTATIENLPELKNYKDNRGVLNFLCIVIEKNGIKYKVPNDFLLIPLEEKKAAL